MSWAISYFSSKVLKGHSLMQNQLDWIALSVPLPLFWSRSLSFQTMGILQLLQCVSDVIALLTHHPWLPSTFTLKPKV